MIPKVIHYCWFGGGRIPAYLQECIDSWSAIMPNYKIKCWTEDNFDVNQIRFVKEAYDNRKFAFVTCEYMHYIRKEVFIWIQMS